MRKFLLIGLVIMISIVTGCSEENSSNVTMNTNTVAAADVVESEVKKPSHEIIYDDVEKLFNALQTVANQNGFELSNKDIFYQRIEGVPTKFCFVNFGSVQQNVIESWINEDNSVNNVNIIVKKIAGDVPKAEVMVNTVLDELGLSMEEHNRMWNDVKDFDARYDSGLIEKVFYGHCAKLNKKISMQVSISDESYQYFIRLAKD